MGDFGEDANGYFKRLPGGGVLRVSPRLFNNALLTFSRSQEDDGWRDGW